MLALLLAGTAALPPPLVSVSADLEGAHHPDQVALRMEKGELVLEVSTASGHSARQALGSGAASFRLDGQERTLAVEDIVHAGHPFILVGAREQARVLLYVLRWDPSDPKGPLLSAYAQGKMFVSDAGRPPDAISVSTGDGTITAAGLERGEQGSHPALFHFRWSSKDAAFEPSGVDPAR